MTATTPVKALIPGRAGYTIRETCEILGISRSGCYRLMEAGHLRFVHVGFHRRILASSIEAMLTPEAVR